MARAALALMLAASLLLAGVSLDAAEAKALFRRFGRGPKALRRLSANLTLHDLFPQPCIDACPTLEALFDDKTEIDQKYPEGEVLDPPWKQDYAETVMWCEYKDTVECVVAGSDQCTNSSGADVMAGYHPMLDCICNKCPGGKQAFAIALDDHDDDGADSDDPAIDTTDDPEGGRRAMDALNFTTVKKCAKYSLAKCMEDYPTECGALGYQYSDDELDELESTCTGEYAPGGGDDDAGDVVGGCGPVGPGRIAASLAPMMAVLQLAAA